MIGNAADDPGFCMFAHRKENVFGIYYFCRNLILNSLHMQKLLSFLRNNRWIIILGLIFICFKSLWEKLATDWVIVPLFSHFSSGWLTTLLFIFISGGIGVYQVVSMLRKKVYLTDRAIGLFLLVVSIWGYYRFNTESAIHLDFCSSLCYIDVIPILCLHVCLKYGRLKKRSNTLIDIKSGFHVDTPITKSEHDILGRVTDAKAAVDKLLATNTDNEAFTFGIVATWGNGKTSFMRLMEEYLLQTYKNEVIIMRFNPWMYRNESNLTRVFLDELSHNLSSYSRDLSVGIVQYARLLSDVDNGWMKFMIKLFLSYSTKTASEQYALLKRKIKRIERKIFVFIDDLDRLNSVEMEEMLRLVRNTSNLPNMYFIVAYDKKYVVDTLKNHYTSHSLKYLDKILQEEYELPVITSEQVKELLLFTCKNSLDDEEFEQMENFFNRNLFMKLNPFSFIKTLRDVKRITNQYIFSVRKLHGGEVDLSDFFLFELFRFRYPLVVKLLAEEKEAILFYKSSLDKYVYYSKENVSSEEVGDSKLFKRNYIDLVDYVKNHLSELCVDETDVEKISEFLDALFGSFKQKGNGTINNPHYSNRFFCYSVLESEVSEKEWNELYRLPFKEMKPKIKEWVIHKSFSLIDRIQEVNPKEKSDVYKLLRLSFYIGALLKGKHYSLFEFINRLLQILYSRGPNRNSFLEEDRKEMRECLTENGINQFQMDYLYSLFNNGSYGEQNILTREEVVEMQYSIFKQYINEEKHTMAEILAYWRDTAHQVFIPHGDGRGHLEYRHREDSTMLMREYAMNHIEEFVQNIIDYFRPSANSEYILLKIVLQLWGNWDSFYEYVDSQPGDSPVIAEFKTFLTKYKDAAYSPVPFNFEYIKLQSID